MRHVAHDLRYALRMMRKKPGFTLLMIFILALGIGSTSSIFSIVNAILFRPLPYRDPTGLVALWGTQSRLNKAPLSAADFWDIRSQAQAFEEVAAYSGQSFNLVDTGGPERIEGAIVSANFFQLFGVNSLLGRTFMAQDEQASATRSVLISEALWRRRFGADPGVIGRKLTLNDGTFDLVGVMPQSFQFPSRTDLWMIPQRFVPEPPVKVKDDLLKLRGVYYLGAIGRLKPGVAVERAQAELQGIAHRLGQEYPETNEGHGLRLVPLHEEIVGNVRPALLTLLGAVAFVLLIACSNVANLLLGRAIARQKEFNIRIALGAGRLRIVQQLLTESVLLALIGGALGLLLAGWGTNLLIAISPPGILRDGGVGVDGLMLAITLLVSLLTGISFGLVPALQAWKADSPKALVAASRGSSDGQNRRRLRNTLVVAEVALSFALLISAGLLLRSFYQLQNIDLGFDSADVLTMQLSLPRTKYVEPARIAVFYDQVLERLRGLPGVKAVGAISKLPLSGPGISGPLTIEGQPVRPSERLLADRRMVSSDYFRAMSIPLKRGRFFSAQDAGGRGIALVNEAAVKQFWGNEDPVGKRVSISDSQQEWLEVVGVVGNVTPAEISAAPKPEVYLPYFQSPWANMTVVARLEGSAPSMAASFRQQVLAVDPNQPVYNVQTLDEIVAASVSQPRFNLILLALFAALALVLAMAGLYGVMTATVAQRTKEIGIRMALGAQPREIFKMVITQGMLLVILGLCAGLVIALIMTHTISSILFKVPATDFTTYAVVSIFLLLVMFIANIVPARRATKINPLAALIHE